MSTDPTGARVQPAPDPDATGGPVGLDADVEEHANGSGDNGGTASSPRRQRVRATAEPSRRSGRDRLSSVLERPAASGRPTPAPAKGRKVRRVHRVIRHVEVWSVFKVTAAFAACGYVMVLVSGYLLWRAADRVGTIDGIEGFLEDAGGYDRFDLLGSTVFRVAAFGGLVLAAGMVAMAVLAAVLFNLISDITGGIRMTVIDEDLVVVPARGTASPTGSAPSSGSPASSTTPGSAVQPVTPTPTGSE